MFEGPFGFSILGNAKRKKILDIEHIDIREFGIGKHKLVDDTPYGGGVGMVMRVDVIDRAIEKAKCQTLTHKEHSVLLDAGGKSYTQKKAALLATYDHLILVCGRYEGVDERVRNLVDEELSIGDYVLTGGEIPAMVVVDTVARLLPGVLGKEESSRDESFQESTKAMLLEYPQYTRPEVYKDSAVPKILLSGNHKKIASWRKEKAISRTREVRPDLLKSR